MEGPPSGTRLGPHHLPGARPGTRRPRGGRKTAPHCTVSKAEGPGLLGQRPDSPLESRATVPMAPAAPRPANASSSLSPQSCPSEVSHSKPTNPPPFSTCSGLTLGTTCGFCASTPGSSHQQILLAWPAEHRQNVTTQPPPNAALVPATAFLLHARHHLLAGLSPTQQCPSKTVRSRHSARSPLGPPSRPPHSDTKKAPCPPIPPSPILPTPPIPHQIHSHPRAFVLIVPLPPLCSLPPFLLGSSNVSPSEKPSFPPY